MITSNRRRLVHRSLACLANQTWSNTELVIIDDGEENLESLLELYKDNFKIRYERINYDPQILLGGLRNLSLELASGEYCIQWDDDEWYHPERIATQMRFLQERDLDAVTLRYVLVHLAEPLFWEHPFRYDSINGTYGTILHRRSDIRYPNQERVEDRVYYETFKKSNRTGMIEDPSGHLFIRCYHGDNTWNRKHFLNRLNKSLYDRLDYYLSRYLLGNIFRHHAFQIEKYEQAAFRDFVTMNRDLGLFQDIDLGRD
jgi:glycosyltransferase involved in cell wall biosynthesis